MEMLDELSVTIVAEDSVGYETPFLGQHGVSFYLQARRGAVTYNVLVDVAQHPEPLLGNMELLGIDPGSIDAIVLTHCHYDHTQGLVRIIEATGKQDIPVIAHPDLFRMNFATQPFLRHVGVMNSDRRENIMAAGGSLFEVRDPLQLMPGLVTSGEVPRVTDYENKETSLKTIRDGHIVVDEMMDELSVYANVADVGTIVVTGCSHAGVVNIVKHAKAVGAVSEAAGAKPGSTATGDATGGAALNGPGTGPARAALGPTVAGDATGAAARPGAKADTGAKGNVAAVIGGFHLIEAHQERIQRTASDLKAEGVGHVYAGHCTGFPAQVELHSVFGQSFTPLRTGQVYRFGGA